MPAEGGGDVRDRDRQSRPARRDRQRRAAGHRAGDPLPPLPRPLGPWGGARGAVARVRRRAARDRLQRSAQLRPARGPLPRATGRGLLSRHGSGRGRGARPPARTRRVAWPRRRGASRSRPSPRSASLSRLRGLAGVEWLAQRRRPSLPRQPRRLAGRGGAARAGPPRHPASPGIRALLLGRDGGGPLMAALSEELRAAAASIWDAQHAHPFVRGIGEGTLDRERFRFWVRQDYLFLIEYARMLSLGAARAPDLETMERFADLAQATLRGEMELHRSYAAELGIAPVALEAESMAPTTRAYTDLLVRVAASGDFAELVAALLPCMWGFSEIGLRLAEDGAPSDPGYARWVEMYSSREFAELAAWCRELMDRVGEGLGARARRRIEDAFVTSSRYELAFWEMAWTLETWPV